MDLSNLSTEMILIGVSAIIIISFFFGELSRKTNVPSVLMLIIFGVICQSIVKIEQETLRPILGLLGTVGLIMIVLEAALELELKREKYIPIAKAMAIALIGLLASAYVAAEILFYFYEGDGMTIEKAWIYATPLSILSSAIIIPSVSGLNSVKKEFHIYESTFSDILGIIVFYYLTGQLGNEDDHGGGLVGYGGNVLLTIVVSFIASYLIILIFQSIKSHTKLFLLIAVLLLLYGVGKEMHLSALIVILIFGLIIANMKLFFKGILGRWLHLEKANQIYEGLHVITMETAFVVRTFFFVIFGLSINLLSLNSLNVAIISGLIIGSIYIIRYLTLRPSIGEDINPQLYIAPRGLITILLFYKIPEAAKVEAFNSGILLFIIIGTSLIMTVAMIMDKRNTGKAIRKAEEQPVGYEKWRAPSISDVIDNQSDNH
ncbi:cation:proton antiporter [bacterium]|nr:cation:proton antiporter [bacterium]MDB4443692.1 cation:proton antiporter [Saprospiraceae bacterium]MDC3219497.1 cation:proton antiporter [Saprospiraceae bacterium]